MSNLLPGQYFRDWIAKPKIPAWLRRGTCMKLFANMSGNAKCLFARYLHIYICIV